MPSLSSKDRASLCSFTFKDGRRCRTPRRDDHPHLCVFHARREAQALAGAKVGEDIAFYLSGAYVSACDLRIALGRLFTAVAQGYVKPKTAATLAYLGHTLVQTRLLAEHEHGNADSPESWRRANRTPDDPSVAIIPPVPQPPPPPTLRTDTPTASE